MVGSPLMSGAMKYECCRKQTRNMKKRSPWCNLPAFSVYRPSNLLSVPQPINKPRLAWTVSKLVNIIHTENRYGYMKSTNADPLWTLPEEAPRIGEKVFITVQKPTALFWQYQRGLPGVRLNRRASLMSGSKRLRSKDPTLPANFSTFVCLCGALRSFPRLGRDSSRVKSTHLLLNT